MSYTKNQLNQELVLWENQQDRWTLSQTNQRVQRSVQINKIRNENGDITTETEEIQKNHSDSTTKTISYTKLENPDVMDKFLDR